MTTDLLKDLRIRISKAKDDTTYVTMQEFILICREVPEWFDFETTPKLNAERIVGYAHGVVLYLGAC